MCYTDVMTHKQTNGAAQAQPLIDAANCKITARAKDLTAPFDWQMKSGEVWLAVGPGGGGKEAFRDALAGQNGCRFEPVAPGGTDVHTKAAQYANIFADSTVCVSLENAAALIREERERDESDYIEGGVDHGRTAREYIGEVLGTDKDTRRALAARLETMPETRLCGIEAVLDRGVKYLSTGEIRRTLICRALLAGKHFIILSEPFAGLDAQSRGVLLNFFDSLAARQKQQVQSGGTPQVLLCMDRYADIPPAVTHVLEFTQGRLSFSGERAAYERELGERQQKNRADREQAAEAFVQEVAGLQAAAAAADSGGAHDKTPLVEMRDVHVGWGDKTVLDHLSWTLYAGEHWLIRGPNGSGKTTLLELISGDNMQVFCNDVRIFGRPRGSGETVWELKARMGIVSYRLHLEYRMVSGTDIESVIISGLKDTIGLYEPKSDLDRRTAAQWLALGGFLERRHEPFSALSYGEQRELLILRAAVKCPPLLILDEPCHALDEQQRERVLSLLETIARGGTSTLLHVTHDPAEALACERHILELRPGETPMYRILNKEEL